jgi:hypothetical protein
MRRGVTAQFALLIVVPNLVLAGSVMGAANAKAWTGFGAPLSAWITTHPKNRTHCSAGGCYGGQARIEGTWTDQFLGLSTTGPPTHRVDGYLQEIGDGTSLADAKADVVSLLPPDTKTTAFWVEHNGGNSCALWNLNSKTLAVWLAKDYSNKGPNPFQNLEGPQKPGDVGVELDSGGSVLKLNDVIEASVSTLANSKSTTC